MEMEMTARLEILRNSLDKKQAEFDEKLADHFSTVKAANGQPLNDKRNGRSTLDRWERQNDSLRSLDSGIQKTRDAIEREESKVALVSLANETTPSEILALVADGVLLQWRKHPNTFFVADVEKARIVWDSDKKVVAHRYVSEIKDRDQHRKFAQVFNGLKTALTATA